MFRKPIFSVAFIIIVSVYVVAGESLFDILSWDSSTKTETQRADSSHKSCICNGPACICCVDFNFLYIDLGGPGCVHMKYKPQDRSMAVNVSYGENLFHSDQINDTNSKTTCMPIFSTLAEMCAKFVQIQRTADGLDGCVLLEPKVLGDFQTQIKMGCFSANPQGIKFNSTTDTFEDAVLQETTLATNTSSVEPEEEINEEELLAAVSESAQQGLSFFNQLISLAFGNSNSNSSQPQEQNSPHSSPNKEQSS